MNFENYLSNKITDSMFLEPLTEMELLPEINSLNDKKSTGHDEISAKIIKYARCEIIKPLTYIYNLTFQNGKIPDILKKALVTPVFKSNENNLFENYRPISVLTVFSKLLEKLMYKRLYKYIENIKFFQKNSLVSEKINQLNMQLSN